MSSNPRRYRRNGLALVADTVRTLRISAAVWIIGGTAFTYLMALALASEMDRFPGGRQAFAQSILVGAQALRPLRWPADRLDTLGGYLTYHNVTLFTFFLAVYAAVQATRAVRGAEDKHVLEEVLATGWSRLAVIRDRAAGFLLTMALISLGLGLGLAASLAAGGEPDLSGSLITMGTAGLCAMVGYSLGLLISQLTPTAGSAAGLTSLLLTVLYVGTNIWEELGFFGGIRFVSPFYYANASRALVPGYGLDLPATGALLALSAVPLILAGWAFVRRDYGSPLWVRRAGPGRAVSRRVRMRRRMLGSVWTVGLLRARLGLLVWAGAAAAFSAMMALLQPAVMEAWSTFDWLAGFTGAGGTTSAEEQYISFSGEIVIATIAAFVVTRAAGWAADLAQGRVEVILAAPVSWSRLVWERLFALIGGVAVITAGGLAGLGLGAVGVGVDLDLAGLGRLAADCVLLGAALGAVGAVVVAGLRGGASVTVLAVYIGGSYLLGYLAPLFDWPEWVNRLSVLSAFGHPYLEWPPLGGIAVLLAVFGAGSLLAAAIAERTPKVA
jgi:ABC-2 type transport system permease protein